MTFGFGAEPDVSTEYQRLASQQAALQKLIELTNHPEWVLLAEMCQWNVDNKLRSLLRVDTLERLSDLKGEIRALEWVIELPLSLATEIQRVTDALAALAEEQEGEA